MRKARDNRAIPRLETSIRNLDAVLNGGLPKGTILILGGLPGAGKTILTQQMVFHNASPDRRALYFSTLSETTAKTLVYLQQFEYFQPEKLEHAVQFIDLGVILRAKGLEECLKIILEHLQKVKPAFVVFDSFKAFEDLAKSREEVRKFGYELIVHLVAWECTAFLLGEYGPQDYLENPLFSAIDGVIAMSQRESSGEQQRFLQVFKMRGTPHSADEHIFHITERGVELFAPRVTLQRQPRADVGKGTSARYRTGISSLDGLLGKGISRGSTLLVSGMTGTGKTVLLLEFIFRGAQKREKGIFFSFEETRERLLAVAEGLGFDLGREIERGMVEIIFFPQPEIQVERHLLMMHERAVAFGAKRLAIDSSSVFLHKVKDPQIYREKMFQLATIVQNQGAVGLFASDVPYGSQQISRMEVEETVVDGIVLLTLTEEGFLRRRYLEVYKLRNTNHLLGRHPMVIEPGGIKISRQQADGEGKPIRKSATAPKAERRPPKRK
jgi:circadian clock protein KaiC